MFVNGEFDVSDELNEMSVTAYAIFLIKPHDLSSLAWGFIVAELWTS